MALADAVAGRAWRTYADVRRWATRSGSARAGRGTFSAEPGDADWLTTSAREFEQYRAAYPPADSAVSVVCVTNRPAMLDAVVGNIARQRGVEVEPVIVTNSDGFDPARLERIGDELERCAVLRRPPDTSLGSCLNAGLDSCSHRFVAKFDDDDLYGEHYLADALRAHAYAGAAVVGKHTYYADVAPSGDRYLRFPGHEFRYSGTLAGGTLVIDRQRTGGLRFEDRSLGEDRAFLRACHRRGLSTFSTDRFGFVQRRGHDNTWNVDHDDFLIGAVRVDADEPEHAVDAPATD
ncbi:MAG: hypothetical protein CL424_18930 [Acidimicrobiaceae bacterium]|nr:hypothetical protein [Acidimicrobiaceae bacterium]